MPGELGTLWEYMYPEEGTIHSVGTRPRSLDCWCCILLDEADFVLGVQSWNCLPLARHHLPPNPQLLKGVLLSNSYIKLPRGLSSSKFSGCLLFYFWQIPPRRSRHVECRADKISTRACLGHRRLDACKDFREIIFLTIQVSTLRMKSGLDC